MEQSNITFSIGSYVKTPNEPLTPVSLSLAQLCSVFSKPAILTDKLKAPYFLRCIASHRNNNSVSNMASLIIIDADKRLDWLNNWAEFDGSINPFPVHCCLRAYGINHLIYSSYSNGKPDSHNEPMYKWRAVIPCHYPQSRLSDVVDYIINLLHENHLFVAPAKENKAYAQAWFMPCSHPDRVDLFQFFSFADGNCLNVGAIPETQQALLSEPIEPPPRKPLASISTLVSNSPILAFNELYTVHDVLVRNGYKRATNGKYLSPKSSTKEAGVSILRGHDDGIERAKSWHNDVLNDGAIHDPFDCYRLLECGGDKFRALAWNDDITRQNRRDYMRAKELSQAECVA